MSDATAYDPGWSDGGGVSATSSASSPAWWENTLSYVITSAANAKYNQPQLNSGQQYIRDQYGRLVPAGYPTTGQVLNTQTAMPAWAVFAALGLGAVLLLKMAK